VVEGGKSALSLESVKTVSDVYAPGAARVVEVNQDLKAHPELVNQDPYGRGWLFRLELTKGVDPALLDADGYRSFVAGPG